MRLNRVILALAAAAAALAVATTPPAQAQPAATVEVVAQPNLGRGAHGGPIEVVSLSRKVAFGDLDLTTAKNARRLRTRIQAAARSACDRLAELYPVAEGPDCYATAVSRAMLKVEYILGHPLA